MTESSFSLLTQNEIDTLIAFLSQADNGLTREVLSQDSVDKLIHLIQNNDINKIRLDALDALELKPSIDLLKELKIRNDSSELCELCFTIETKTNHLSLFAKNMVTEKEYQITPATLDRTELLHGISSFGYSIPPILFDKIARIFNLKYSRNTYEDICSLFLSKNFDSSQQKVPSLYCPSSTQLLDNLL